MVHPELWDEQRWHFPSVASYGVLGISIRSSFGRAHPAGLSSCGGRRMRGMFGPTNHYMFASLRPHCYVLSMCRPAKEKYWNMSNLPVSHPVYIGDAEWRSSSKCCSSFEDLTQPRALRCLKSISLQLMVLAKQFLQLVQFKPLKSFH